MNTYCEILPSKNYALQEINPKVLIKLASLLNQLGDAEFEQLSAAVNMELKRHIPSYFAEAGQQIVFCKKCGAVGNRKNEDQIIHGKYLIEECPVCDGDGSRVRKTFVLYEKIDSNKRKRFAIDGYPRANTPAK